MRCRRLCCCLPSAATSPRALLQARSRGKALEPAPPRRRSHIVRFAFPYQFAAGWREVAMPAAPRRRDVWDNPMGTDGFEFVEYTGPDPAALGALFERMGFVAAARHRSKNVTLYKQGDV